MTELRTIYLQPAEVAKLIRADLKTSFPGVKFSVRTSVYAGGASVSVGWTDGPAQRDVQSIAGSYAGARFDLRDDILQYLPGRETVVDGEKVLARSGADYVFVTRTLSAQTADRYTSQARAELQACGAWLGEDVFYEGQTVGGESVSGFLASIAWQLAEAAA